MTRVMLANEFGAGRGHLVTLRTVAEAMGQGFTYDAALARREHAAELTPVGAAVFPGPALNYDRRLRLGPQAVPTATWGDFLGDLGFQNPKRLGEILTWWHQVLTSRRIDIMVADYAPLAMVAARGLGIPVIATGTGYGLPPSNMAEFPVFLPEYSTRLHDEAALLANINQALQGIEGTDLPSLPALYAADLPLVRTLDFLDPYQALRPSPPLPPVADVSDKIAGDGDEVFVYFSTRELLDPMVVDALVSLPVPRRGYLPAPPPGVAERLAASGMVLEPAAIPVAAIAARSRMVLNAGQHGILCLGMFAGLPQLCLPQHLEQLFHARRAEARGVAQTIGTTADARAGLTDRILDVYHSKSMRHSARDLAGELRLPRPPDPAAALRARLAQFLGDHAVR